MKNEMLKDMPNFKNMSNAELINLTIAALNDGSEYAMNEAYFAKEEAKARCNQFLVDKLEYLWDVI